MSRANPQRAALEELLSLSGPAFIEAAYRRLLGRSPDGLGGRYYLDQLRSGCPKENILFQLSRSREGRARGTVLKGLVRRYYLGRLADFPLIGRLFRGYRTIEGEESPSAAVAAGAQAEKDSAGEPWAGGDAYRWRQLGGGADASLARYILGLDTLMELRLREIKEQLSELAARLEGGAHRAAAGESDDGGAAVEGAGCRDSDTGAPSVRVVEAAYAIGALQEVAPGGRIFVAGPAHDWLTAGLASLGYEVTVGGAEAGHLHPNLEQAASLPDGDVAGARFDAVVCVLASPASSAGRPHADGVTYTIPGGVRDALKAGGIAVIAVENQRANLLRIQTAKDEGRLGDLLPGWTVHDVRLIVRRGAWEPVGPEGISGDVRDAVLLITAQK